MYEWVVFFHVAGTFLFLMSHGASIMVAFRLRKESEVSRIRALLDLSSLALKGMWAGVLILLAAGIIAGFMGKWWGQGWIWVSIGILVVVSAAMMVISSRAYYPLRTAVGLPDPWTKVDEMGEPDSAEDIQGFIDASQPHLMAVIGLGGFFIILGLMMFKPF